MRAYLLFIACLAVGACRAPPEPARSVPPRVQTRAERPLEMPCPLGVRNAAILAEDTDAGIDVTLTSLDRPEELRRRANDVARQYGPLAHRGGGHLGVHGQGHQHGLQTMQWPSSKIRVVEIPLGAQLQITPTYEVAREGLRSTVRRRVLQIASTPCEEDLPRINVEARPTQVVPADADPAAAGSAVTRP